MWCNELNLCKAAKPSFNLLPLFFISQNWYWPKVVLQNMVYKNPTIIHLIIF
jgi:hypothetical protein